MTRILLILILWIVTIIASIIWSYENPEKIEKFKNRKKISIRTNTKRSKTTCEHSEKNANENRKNVKS